MDDRRLFGAQGHRFMSAITACPCERGLVFEEEGRDPLGECTPSTPVLRVEAEGAAFHCVLVCHEHMYGCRLFGKSQVLAGWVGGRGREPDTLTHSKELDREEQQQQLQRGARQRKESIVSSRFAINKP